MYAEWVSFPSGVIKSGGSGETRNSLHPQRRQQIFPFYPHDV